MDIRTLFLLRNQSRGKRVGFFEAGNFLPDFILWPVSGETQDVVFIDPKGLRNLGAFSDPTIQFGARIRERESAMGDPSTGLNSFLLSDTGREKVQRADPSDWPKFDVSNVLFMNEPGYVSTLLRRVVDRARAAS